jgi:threonine dehydrogenase-like Zn-dependent dehydrogenase
MVFEKPADHYCERNHEEGRHNRNPGGANRRGAGPVGLGALVNARFIGSRVIVVEWAPWRMQRTREMGGTVLDANDGDRISKIKAVTADLGVDMALDCSGTVARETTPPGLPFSEIAASHTRFPICVSRRCALTARS